MKHLKLFEKWSDQEFYRLNQEPFDNSEDEFEFYRDSEHNFKGSRPLNEFLVKMGFPSGSNSVDFMDSVALNRSKQYEFLWGSNKYRVKIDQESNLGWSFKMPKNDIFYKCLRLPQLDEPTRSQDKVLKKMVEKYPYGQMRFFYDRDKNTLDDLDENERDLLERIYQFLVDYHYIGKGTLDNLKSSPLWGTTPLYAWTDDKILMSKIM